MDENGVLPVSALTTIDEPSIVLPDTIYHIGPITYGVVTQTNAALIRQQIPVVSSLDILESILTHLDNMEFPDDERAEYRAFLQRRKRWMDMSEAERKNLLDEDARVLALDRTNPADEQKLQRLPASAIEELHSVNLPSGRLLPHEQNKLEHLERVAPIRSRPHAEIVANLYEYSRAYSLRVVMYALRGIDSETLPWEVDSQGRLTQQVAELIPPADMMSIQNIGENFLALSAEIKKNSVLQST